MEKIKFVLIISLMIACSTISICAQDQLYVSVDGNDSNSGTITSPLQTLIGARNQVRSIIASSGLPDGGIVVNFRGGIYPVTSTCHMDASDSGTSGSPVVYRGYKNEEVIFDGSLFIDNSQFQLCSSSQADKLHNDAIGHVYSQKINDDKLISLLESDDMQMTKNGHMMTVARYPNIGYATINKYLIDKETDNLKVEGTFEDPMGPRFKLSVLHDFSKWQDEILRTKRVVAKGYISAQWLKATNYLVSESDGYLQLMNGTEYGLSHLVDMNRPNRIYFTQLLCELDEAGEWYFDKTDNTLYMWISEAEKQSAKIGVLAGPMMLRLQDAKHIHFTHMTIQNLGAGENGDAAIHMQSGSSYFIAGVTFRNIASPLTSFNTIDVSNSTILSCDFIDNHGNSRLYGGSFDSKGVVSVGNNTIENCHFTRVYAKEFDGKATHINGVGNSFKNNLVHNVLCEPITHEGLDHHFSYNEIFNTGIVEGDDGAISCGNDVMSYGNLIEYNFIHHNMDVPTLYGRAGVMRDDYDGGDIIQRNIMYKGGGDAAIKMNRGAGHQVLENVMLDCGMGIMQSDGGATTYATTMEFINSTNGKKPTDSNKENYIGRMLGKIGVENWTEGLDETNWLSRIEPYWTNKYPTFYASMKAYSDNDEMNAYECRFYDNLFWSNGKGNVRSGSADVQRSTDVDLSIFEDAESLNFKFIEPLPSYATENHFEDIGLYVDAYRSVVPNKDSYRKAIKEHFDGQDCYGGTYDAETINERLFYNTGELVLSMIDNTEAEVMSANFVVASGVFENHTSGLKITAVLSATNNTGKDITFSIEDLGTGSADSGIDYETIGDDARVSIPHGKNYGSFIIELHDDALAEFTETIDLQVSKPNYAYVSAVKSSFTASILDDDAYVAHILPLRNASEDNPSSAKFSIYLNRTNQSGKSIFIPIVDLYTGNAVSGDDYNPLTDQEAVEIKEGEISSFFSLEVLDDEALETGEDVCLQIASQVNVLLQDSIASVTIIDDDAVTAVLSASETYEDDSLGIIFTVSLSQVNNTEEDILFDIKDFDDGDAFSGIDYEELSWFAKVVVPSGSATGQLIVPIIQDSRVESKESINVEMSNCSSDRVFITQATATAYILDREANGLTSYDEGNVEIYPNPVGNTLGVKLDLNCQNPTSIKIFNYLTKSFVSEQYYSDKIDVAMLKSGLYFVQLTYPEHTITKKFVKL